MQQEALTAIVNEIVKSAQQPRDLYEVTALLESMGWTDEVVQEKFGFHDCFELGAEVFRIISFRGDQTQYQRGVEKIFKQPFLVEVRFFLRGIMFAMPMIISIASILYLRFSLWSYMDFTVDIATAIALGTILSFGVTGGFIQAVARRGMLYIGMGEYGMALRMTYNINRFGMVVSLLVAVLVVLVNLIFEFFPARMLTTMVMYYIFLSVMWLAITVLYTLREEIMFNLIIVGGIAILFVLKNILGLSVLVAQPISLLFSAFGSAFLAYARMRSKQKEMEAGVLTPALPRSSIVVYTIMEFFMYGIMFFMLLNVDRVMAWSTNDAFMPTIIWFRGEYELGLDWALFGIIIPMGLVELYVNRYSQWLVFYQNTTLAAESEFIVDQIRSRFVRERIVIGLWSTASLTVLYLFYRFILAMGILPAELQFNQITNFVFLLAAPGYVMLSIALLNSVYLFCLSQPAPVNRALMLALFIDIMVGFILSRTVAYHFAVFGFLAGMLFFMILTTRAVDKVFTRVDYAYYRAL